MDANSQFAWTWWVQLARKVGTLLSLVMATVLTSLALTSCRSTIAPGPSERPPPAVAGAWIAVVDGVGIRLDLTENPAFHQGSGSFDVEGVGTLTVLSTAESVGIRASGSNRSTWPNGDQQVLINLFPLSLPLIGTYGQFTGSVHDGTLMGVIRTRSGNIGTLVPTSGLQDGKDYAALFSRP
jgi:hypothetical protein